MRNRRDIWILRGCKCYDGMLTGILLMVVVMKGCSVIETSGKRESEGMRMKVME